MARNFRVFRHGSRPCREPSGTFWGMDAPHSPNDAFPVDLPWGSPDRVRQLSAAPRSKCVLSNSAPPHARTNRRSVTAVYGVCQRLARSSITQNTDSGVDERNKNRSIFFDDERKSSPATWCLAFEICSPFPRLVKSVQRTRRSTGGSGSHRSNRYQFSFHF